MYICSKLLHLSINKGCWKLHLSRIMWWQPSNLKQMFFCQWGSQTSYSLPSNLNPRWWDHMSAIVQIMGSHVRQDILKDKIFLLSSCQQDHVVSKKLSVIREDHYLPFRSILHLYKYNMRPLMVTCCRLWASVVLGNTFNFLEWIENQVALNNLIISIDSCMTMHDLTSIMLVIALCENVPKSLIFSRDIRKRDPLSMMLALNEIAQRIIQSLSVCTARTCNERPI